MAMHPLSARRIVNAYAVILTLACFLWPVVLGIQGLTVRLLWILCASGLLGTSIFVAGNACDDRSIPTISTSRAPWWFFAILALPSLLIGATMPITAFSDEEAIALPTLSALFTIVRAIGWPALLLCMTVGILCAVLAIRRLTPHGRLFFLAGGALVATGMAFTVPHVIGLAIRYPPLVHLAQGFFTLLTVGHPALFRVQNAGWTILLAWTISHGLPGVSRTARVAAMTVATLTPLGLSYRVLLYQVSGEIWFGMAASLIVAAMITRNDKHSSGGMLGMLFGLWILYRPTSLALCATIIALLWMLRYKRAAWDVTRIAMPIGLLWILVYLFGSFQYDFLQPSSGRAWTISSITQPIIHTLRELPQELHPVGLALLLVGSIIILWRSHALRPLLLIGWTIAIINTGIHQLLTIDRWYGYGRFNALLMLPLMIITLGLSDRRFSGRFSPVVSLLIIAGLAFNTPWNFSRYLQMQRGIPAEDVERSTAGGSVPLPASSVVHDMLMAGKVPAILLSPSYGFLDLEIARGTLTVAKRTELLRQSARWSPDHEARPVVIQAPTDSIRYWGNLTESDERRLIEAATWAQSQPTVRTIPYGADRVLIVE